MLSINTNLSSMIAQSSMKSSTNKLNEAVERMSTGYRINHAKDNAANYSISTNMTTKLSAYDVAADNVAMGMDMLTTASENLSQIESKLSRLRALATQAQNDTYGGQSLDAIQTEANSITSEIQRIYETAEYNGIKLFEPKSIMPQKDLSNIERVSKADSLERDKSYRIDDHEDLIALQDFVKNGGDTTGITFELSADINMKDVAFERIGNSSNPFKGIFNGNGFVIKNLEINATYTGVGLFGTTEGASIDSLGVVNCNIVSAGAYVGGLIGKATNSKISNCYVVGEIKGSNSSVGGLVGISDGSIIEACYTNCTISTDDYAVGGLIGQSRENTSVKNSYSQGTVFSKTNDAGGLIGVANLTTISNCYSTADVIGGNFRIGGLVGWAEGAIIKKSYSTGDVIGDTRVGGLVGQGYRNSIIEDCYTISFVSGNIATGAFVGIDFDNTTTGSGNYCSNNQGIAAVGSGTFAGVESKTEAELKNICTNEKMGFVESNGWKVADGELHLAWEAAANLTKINLQVGIDSRASSNIEFKLGFIMNELDDLTNNGILESKSLATIDKLIDRLSEKQIQLGSTQNRLDSALDEITTQYENLASARSTIRDADMAELSSQYIQQQILQEASATLMAVANQSPAIALQLI